MDRKPFNNGGTGTAFLWNFVQGGMDMATLEKINAFLKAVNAAAWGPPLLFLLLGTGIFLPSSFARYPFDGCSLRFVQHSAVRRGTAGRKQKREFRRSHR